MGKLRSDNLFFAKNSNKSNGDKLFCFLSSLPLLPRRGETWRTMHCRLFVNCYGTGLFKEKTTVLCSPGSFMFPRHHGSNWLLPVISLLLTKTVLPVRACLSIWLKIIRERQKEDEPGLLSILFLYDLKGLCSFSVLAHYRWLRSCAELKKKKTFFNI